MAKVVVITGGSSGIGRATAEYYVQSGYRVYELSRHGENQDGITHLTCDVTSKDSVGDAISSVLSAEKKIDVLVCNAGMGISGAVEFTTEEELKKIFNVNLFGVVNTINAVIPSMRKNGGGNIVCVSSVAGMLSIPFQTFYSATKSAVNSLVLGLRNELNPFKIKICAVMPGDVKTGFTAAREKSSLGREFYGDRIERAVSGMERDEEKGMSPKRIAKKIFRLGESKHPKPLSTVGFGYKAICILVKLLPYSLVNKIVGWLYSK